MQSLIYLTGMYCNWYILVDIEKRKNITEQKTTFRTTFVAISPLFAIAKNAKIVQQKHIHAHWQINAD